MVLVGADAAGRAPPRAPRRRSAVSFAATAFALAPLGWLANARFPSVRYGGRGRPPPAAPLSLAAVAVGFSRDPIACLPLVGLGAWLFAAGHCAGPTCGGRSTSPPPSRAPLPRGVFASRGEPWGRRQRRQVPRPHQAGGRAGWRPPSWRSPRGPFSRAPRAGACRSVAQGGRVGRAHFALAAALAILTFTRSAAAHGARPLPGSPCATWTPSPCPARRAAAGRARTYAATSRRSSSPRSDRPARRGARRLSRILHGLPAAPATRAPTTEQRPPPRARHRRAAEPLSAELDGRRRTASRRR